MTAVTSYSKSNSIQIKPIALISCMVQGYEVCLLKVQTFDTFRLLNLGEVNLEILSQ